MKIVLKMIVYSKYFRLNVLKLYCNKFEVFNLLSLGIFFDNLVLNFDCYYIWMVR